jgi:hypothetical protein
MIRKHNSSKQAAADARLRRNCYWDRSNKISLNLILYKVHNVDFHIYKFRQKKKYTHFNERKLYVVFYTKFIYTSQVEYKLQ